MTSSFSGLVGDNRVHRTVYVSPRVLEAERERIFGGSWLYVGHESQIPSAGDYFCTEAAGRPVFMIRHGSGDVHVLHNHCPHRGALVLWRSLASGFRNRLRSGLRDLPPANANGHDHPK
jgi:phenylpropionate dioxygenase-like ring-hydroxylating dioxygenase large terminal subunit